LRDELLEQTVVNALNIFQRYQRQRQGVVDDEELELIFVVDSGSEDIQY
jgi:hypothetical protein